MRRRERQDQVRVPRDVTVYVSADWPGRDESERMSAWASARNAWKAAHAVDTVAGDDYSIPDGLFYPEDI